MVIPIIVIRTLV